MEYELISPEEYDNLPEDRERCFVEFESICRRNLIKLLDRKDSGDIFQLVTGQYMAQVYAVARECSITDIAFPPSIDDENYYSRYSDFSKAVQGEVSRIRIRGRRALHSLSVMLTDNTRAKIAWYLSRLREVIESSDLDKARKAALSGRLDEFEEELKKRRLSLGHVMAVLSAIMVGVASATTIAAEGPAAITTILKLIGVDKETEETALSRLAPPPRALPAPAGLPEQPASAPKAWEPLADNLNDEIPF